jgi:hypothetical protein
VWLTHIARCVRTVRPKGLLNHSYMHGACGSTSTQYAVGSHPRPLVLLVATKEGARRRQDTASGPSDRWRVDIGSCRVAGGDGTLAKDVVGAPRRRSPRAPAAPKPPKRCSYQRPGPGPRPPLARRAGRGGGGDHRAAGARTGAAAGALRRGRRALGSQSYLARP